MCTFINIRVIQSNGHGLSLGNSSQFRSQRRIYGRKFLPLRLFITDTQHFYSHRIQLRHIIIKTGNDYPHRRSVYQQVQKMILFTQTETFVFQLFHHPIEDIYHPVGFILPHKAQPATKILFAQQFHTTTNGIQRLYYLSIKQNKINQQESNQYFRSI